MEYLINQFYGVPQRAQIISMLVNKTHVQKVEWVACYSVLSRTSDVVWKKRYFYTGREHKGMFENFFWYLLHAPLQDVH